MKIPPNNIESEMAVIACMVFDEQALSKTIMKLCGSDFYNSTHTKIFDIIKDMYQDDIKVDPITLSEKMRAKGEYEQLGGLEYIHQCEDEITSTANIDVYIDKVIDNSKRREIIRISNEVMMSQYKENNLTINDFIEKTQQFESTGSVHHIKSLIPYVEQDIDNMLAGKDEAVGIKTSYKEIDCRIGGMMPGNFICVAGRPSNGKTLFGLEVCKKVAERYKRPVLIFSFETSSRGLAYRMLLSKSKLSQNSINNHGSFGSDNSNKLTIGYRDLAGLPVYLVDDPYLTPTKMTALARQFKAKHGDLALIMIDYLQIVADDKYMYRSPDTSEISEKSKVINRMLKELKVPGLIIAQLNRNVEGRADKIPMLGDLRGSGQLEQDADAVLMMYRPYTYTDDKEAKALIYNNLQVYIRKVRDGEIGRVDLKCYPDERG